MPEIASDSSARGIGPRKNSSVNGVVAGEQACVAQVHVDLDDIIESGAVGFEDGGEIRDGLLGLLLDVVAGKLSGSGIDGTGAGNVQKISCAPSLGIGALRRRATLGLKHILGHRIPPESCPYTGTVCDT